MKNVKVSKSVYPNAVTALNVLSGFISIVLASQNEIKYAALFIFVASFFDLIDGLVARMMKTSSKFGVELDSLSDVVSFGAAPSFLIYKVFFVNYGVLGILLSSIILISGTFRLARFNVQLERIDTKLDFKGLPIPVSAVAIAALVLFYYNGLTIAEPFYHIVIPMVILLSFLMVSNIKYNTLPKVKKMSSMEKTLFFAILIAALVLVVITSGKAFFYLILTHILFGIFRYLYLLIFPRKKTEINLNEK